MNWRRCLTKNIGRIMFIINSLTHGKNHYKGKKGETNAKKNSQHKEQYFVIHSAPQRRTIKTSSAQPSFGNIIPSQTARTVRSNPSRWLPIQSTRGYSPNPRHQERPRNQPAGICPAYEDRIQRCAFGRNEDIYVGWSTECGVCKSGGNCRVNQC